LAKLCAQTNASADETRRFSVAEAVEYGIYASVETGWICASRARGALHRLKAPRTTFRIDMIFRKPDVTNSNQNSGIYDPLAPNPRVRSTANRLPGNDSPRRQIMGRECRESRLAQAPVKP